MTAHGANSIKRITCDGAYEDVPFDSLGERYTLSVTANVFAPVVLIIE